MYAGTISTTTHACGAGSTCFLSAIFTGGTSVAVDPAGNAYIAGNTYGQGLPTTPGVLRTDGIGAFVAKINSAGTGLAYLTLLGSANYLPGGGPSSNSNPGNFAYAIAVDAGGNAYVAGSTTDPAFPATPGSVQSKISGAPPDPFSPPPSDAFIAKLNPTGGAMVWSTFLGGNGQDLALGLAIDPGGNVWVSGLTHSLDFPNSSGTLNGGEFLVGVNTSGSALTYSARFPETYPATALVVNISGALALDALGVVHQGGTTGLVTAFTPSSSAPRLFGLENAAGSPLGGRIAPGELISIYGVHLGATTPVSSQFDAAGFLPTSLAGIQVSVNGALAPLLYVSDTQINAVTSGGAKAGSAVLRVIQNGRAVPDFRVVSDTVAPQVFRGPGLTAVAVNQDGTLNSQTNPAKAGSFVAIWATGAEFAGPDGQMATSAQSYCPCEIHSYSNVATSDAALPVAYAGSAPGTVNGVIQINFQVSGGLYYLKVYGKASSPFSVFETP